MRFFGFLLGWVVSVLPAFPERYEEPPILYVAEINAFEFKENPGLQEREQDGEVFYTISTDCGTYKAEFEILKSTVLAPETINISGSIGEWCHLDYMWPYDLYLIVADGDLENVVDVFPASSAYWVAYTQLPTKFWKDDFKNWLGPEFVAALEPKPLSEPLRLYLDELPAEFLKAYSCYDDHLEVACTEDPTKLRAFEQIITFEGPVATIHQAISLDALFLDTAEDK